MFVQINSTTTPAALKTVNGKESLVVPSVLLRETVLENSPNPENPNKPVPHFIAQDEIEASVESWNGTRITMFHPSQRNDVGGNRNVRKRKITVGNLQDAHMDEDRLKAQLIMPTNRIENQRFGRMVMSEAMDGRHIEGSTGYIALYRKAPGGATYNGQPYQYTQHNIQPDHFAILPLGEGKCSIKDGCGLNRNGIALNVLETGRVPNFDGTTSDDWDRQDLSDAIDGFLSNADSDLGEDDLDRNDWGANPEEFRSWSAQRSILGSADEDSYQRGTLWQVVNYETQNLNENALDAVISGRGEQTEGISDRTRTAGQGIARNLLEEEFGRELPDEEETQNMSDRVKSLMREMMDKFGISAEEVVENDDGYSEHCREVIAEQLNAEGLIWTDDGDVKDWREAPDEVLRNVAQKNEISIGHDCCQENSTEQKTEEEPDEETENTTREGNVLSELSDEQMEALSSFSVEQLNALSGLDPEDIEATSELAQNAQAERTSLVEDLVENDEAPYDDAEDLEGVTINTIQKLHESFCGGQGQPSGSNGGEPQRNHVGRNGGGGGFEPQHQRNSNGRPDDDEFEKLQSQPVVTGGPDE